MRRYYRRYRDSTRLNHWAVALLFVLAGLSGVALFHPALFPFTALFGGGQWDRILHPFLGVGMVLGFAALFLQVWRANVWTPRDTGWVKNAHRLVLTGDESTVPPAGKYNAGQKAVFWIFAASLVVLLVSGFVFWQPWFADLFPILARRIAVVAHAAAGFALILSVGIHVYAAIWVKGSMRAMVRGTVSEDWARHNHPLWHQEMQARSGAADQ